MRTRTENFRGHGSLNRPAHVVPTPQNPGIGPEVSAALLSVYNLTYHSLAPVGPQYLCANGLISTNGGANGGVTVLSGAKH